MLGVVYWAMAIGNDEESDEMFAAGLVYLFFCREDLSRFSNCAVLTGKKKIKQVWRGRSVLQWNGYVLCYVMSCILGFSWGIWISHAKYAYFAFQTKIAFIRRPNFWAPDKCNFHSKPRKKHVWFLPPFFPPFLHSSPSFFPHLSDHNMFDFPTTKCLISEAYS